MAGEIKVVAEGFLGGDVELKLVRDREVAEFSVAVGVRKRTEAGEWEDVRTDWVRVAAWGHLGVSIQDLKKGALVRVEGRLVPTAYLGKDGTAHVSLDLIADKIGLIPRTPKADREPVGADAGTPF